MSRNFATHTHASQPALRSQTMSRLAAAALTGSLVIALSALSFSAQAAKPTGGGGGDKTTLGSLSCTATTPFAKWDGTKWLCDVGTAGPKGDTGATGATGDTGPQGLVGPQGLTGDIGPQGNIGLPGDTGDVGAQGEPGLPGDTGDVGAQGDIGLPGAQGDIGLPGDKGDKGDQGFQGIQGAKGDVGPQGPEGPEGPAGFLDLAHTTFIGDSGVATDNCADLLDALAVAVSGDVIVLGPGTFDCGLSRVTLPRGVSLQGSGRDQTTIQGARSPSQGETVKGFLHMMRATTLAHLTVHNTVAKTLPTNAAVEISDPDGAYDWRMKNVSVLATAGFATVWAIRLSAEYCDGGELLNVKARTDASTDGVVAIELACSHGNIKGVNVDAEVYGTSVAGAATPAALWSVGGLVATFTASSFVSPQMAIVSTFAPLTRVISSEIEGLVGANVLCLSDFDGNQILADGVSNNGVACRSIP